MSIKGFILGNIIKWGLKTMGIFDFLKGKKTYIVALVAAVFAFCNASGVYPVTPETEKLVYAVLSAMGLGTLRAGVK